MQIYLHICKIFYTFAPAIKIIHHNMNSALKYLGVVLLLLGVLCLVIYKYAAPENWLLILAMVLEVAGIFAYIFINKKG